MNYVETKISKTFRNSDQFYVVSVKSSKFISDFEISVFNQDCKATQSTSFNTTFETLLAVGINNKTIIRVRSTVKVLPENIIVKFNQKAYDCFNLAHPYEYCGKNAREFFSLLSKKDNFTVSVGGGYIIEPGSNSEPWTELSSDDIEFLFDLNQAKWIERAITKLLLFLERQPKTNKQI